MQWPYVVLVLGIMFAVVGFAMPAEKTITEERCLTDAEHCAEQNYYEVQRTVDNEQRTNFMFGGLLLGLVGGVFAASDDGEDSPPPDP